MPLVLLFNTHLPWRWQPRPEGVPASAPWLHMVVRVAHWAPASEIQKDSFARDCAGQFGWNLHDKTARCALYLTVKVAGGGRPGPSAPVIFLPSLKINYGHFSAQILYIYVNDTSTVYFIRTHSPTWAEKVRFHILIVI